jgi:ketosteroid isomerase-like protein
LWLARAFNAQDVEAAAALYHPEASIVQVDEVHGTPKIARGAEGIRATMAAYIDLKLHMDVVTHHTTIAGDFAMTRSQWLITGQDKDGKTIEVHHHGMEVHRKGEDGTWYFFIDHPSGADPSLGDLAPTRDAVKESARPPHAAARRLLSRINSRLVATTRTLRRRNYRHTDLMFFVSSNPQTCKGPATLAK